MPASEAEHFEVPIETAREALSSCLLEAKRHGLEWHAGELLLTPNAEFADLVHDNDEYVAEDAEELAHVDA